jgi:hypothetical protein
MALKIMKKLIKLLKDIWNGNIFLSPKEKRIKVLAEIKPEPLKEEPKKEEPPLKIGCLAKGLVESFKNERDLWESVAPIEWGFVSTNTKFISYKHGLKKYRIDFSIYGYFVDRMDQYSDINTDIDIRLQGEFPNFNKKEKDYVYNALLDYVINPREEEEKRKKKLKFEQESAYFVDLGCPKQ